MRQRISHTITTGVRLNSAPRLFQASCVRSRNAINRPQAGIQN